MLETPDSFVDDLRVHLDEQDVLPSHTRALREQGLTLVRLIGRGGQGTTYLVEDALAREFAVKILRGRVAADDPRWRQLVSEARLLRNVDHPGIVSCERVHRTGDGLGLLLMDYIPGRPLAAWLGELGEKGLTAERLRWGVLRLIEVCEALAAAHAERLIHRDVKPHNIRVPAANGDGGAILLDFGLALASAADLDGIERQLTHTTPGEFFGSILWAAPEQLDGSRLGPTVDLWAVGVMLRQILAGGRHPQASVSSLQSLIRAISRGHFGPDPTPPASIEPSLFQSLLSIAKRATATSSHKRFASASEMAETMQQALAGQFVALDGQSISRRSLLVAGLGGAALSLAGWSIATNRSIVTKRSIAPTRRDEQRDVATDPDGVERVIPESMRLIVGVGVFCWCPPGRFSMGFSPAERATSDRLSLNVGPWEMTIDRGFWIGYNEVSQIAYRNATGQSPSRHTNGNSDLPVDSVSYHDAVAFCEAASAKFATKFRLPTEAEWEYACRAGTTTRWFFGDEEDALRYYGNAADQSIRHSRDLHEYAPYNDAHPIPTDRGFAPNPWGLINTHGNLWEWCQGPYHADPTLGDDAPGNAIANWAPLRGGSFLDGQWTTRSGHRSRLPMTTAEENIGFRIIADPPPPNA